MPEMQELKATVTIPEGLTPEQVARLKEAFTADLIAILGGADLLRDRNISVVLTEEIHPRVVFGPAGG